MKFARPSSTGLQKLSVIATLAAQARATTKTNPQRVRAEAMRTLQQEPKLLLIWLSRLAAEEHAAVAGMRAPNPLRPSRLLLGSTAARNPAKCSPRSHPASSPGQSTAVTGPTSASREATRQGALLHAQTTATLGLTHRWDTKQGSW